MSNSRVLFFAGYEDLYQHHQPHFLESCSLCHKPLGPNSDIFMYRGNKPFCSEECREEQIGRDESKERSQSQSPWKWNNLSASRRKSENSNKSKAVQSGTLAVA